MRSFYAVALLLILVVASEGRSLHELKANLQAGSTVRAKATFGAKLCFIDGTKSGDAEGTNGRAVVTALATASSGTTLVTLQTNTVGGKGNALKAAIDFVTTTHSDCSDILIMAHGGNGNIALERKPMNAKERKRLSVADDLSFDDVWTTFEPRATQTVHVLACFCDNAKQTKGGFCVSGIVTAAQWSGTNGFLELPQLDFSQQTDVNFYFSHYAGGIMPGMATNGLDALSAHSGTKQLFCDIFTHTGVQAMTLHTLADNGAMGTPVTIDKTNDVHCS